MSFVFTPIVPKSVATTAVALAVGDLRPYNVSGGALAPSLPALSSVRDGSVIIAEKDSADTSTNVVTVTCAGSDTLSGGSTSSKLSLPGERVEYQAATINATRVWKVTRHTVGARLPVWRPNTAYGTGEAVINPSGKLRTATTAFTSGSSYSESNWTDPLASDYLKSATLAQVPVELVTTTVPDNTVNGATGDQRRVIPADDIYQRAADGSWPLLGKGHKPLGLKVPSTKFVMPTTLSSAAGGAMNSQRCCFMPYFVPTGGLTLSALALRLTTVRVGGTGTLVKGAVYADATPGALNAPNLSAGGILGQADFTATTATSNGSKTQAFASGSNVTLSEETWVWFAGFYYAGTSAPSTAPQVLLAVTAQSLWAGPTFDASKYLYTTGTTDLPQSGETLNAGTDALGIVIGGVAA